MSRADWARLQRVPARSTRCSSPTDVSLSQTIPTMDVTLAQDAAEEILHPLEIPNAGKDASTIAPWNVSEASKTEYDLNHALLREFVSNAQGDPKKVAVALRPILEAYLRVTCPEHYPPGTQLGAYITTARQVNPKPLPDEDFKELDKLRDYGNQFHHDSSTTWQENLANLNQTQLTGYAKRVLTFTRPGTRT